VLTFPLRAREHSAWNVSGNRGAPLLPSTGAILSAPQAETRSRAPRDARHVTLELMDAASWERGGRDARILQSAARAGSLVRVHSGVFARATDWSTATDEVRARALLDAVALRAAGPVVFSHESAALLLGVPRIGALPAMVETASARRGGGSTRGIVRRRGLLLAPDDVVEVDGLLCTSPARTMLDLALTRSFANAVVGIDHLLRAGAARDDVREILVRSDPIRDGGRALEVIDFGDPAAETPIESVSRANIRLAGLPAPVLQKVFRDERGFIGRTDFHFEDADVPGEADGTGKYFDAALRSGRSADRVLYDEKLREDRIRALVRGFCRWDWHTAVSPVRLKARLQRAGVR
jgi:hypothetical protein